MISFRQKQANAANARRSTGPLTEAGKVTSSLNAQTHGLESVSPVAAGECPDAWAAFRAAILGALVPVGAAEAALAEQVAALMWRSRRVTRYESAAIDAVAAKAVAALQAPSPPATAGMTDDDAGAPPGDSTPDAPPRQAEVIRKQLVRVRGSLAWYDRAVALCRTVADMPGTTPVSPEDASRLLDEIPFLSPGHFSGQFSDAQKVPLEEVYAVAGVPKSWADQPQVWCGWTAAHLAKGLARLAEVDGLNLTTFLRKQEEAYKLERQAVEEDIQRLESEIAEGNKQHRHAQDIAVVPEGPVLERVLRYETHLTRQLGRVLGQLEQLRSLRCAAPNGAGVDNGLPGGGPAYAKLGAKARPNSPRRAKAPTPARRSF